MPRNKLITLCKHPKCNKSGTRSNKGYCSKHYEELIEKSKIYLAELQNDKTK